MQDSMANAEAQSGAGASVENKMTYGIGVCYECCCVFCAGFGCSGNLVTIPQGSVGIVTEFGRYNRTLPAGRHRFNISAETVFPVTMKVVCLDIPPQAVMSLDNLLVKID